MRMEVKKSWFALYTKPRSEFKAAEQLNAVNIHYYLPVVTKLKQWSDRKKKIDEPLIKSYIFIYASEAERLRSLEQFSIVRCLYERGRPAPIPDWQIENLKKMLEEKADVFVSDGLIKGAKIKIIDGPFKDVTGILVEDYKGKSLAVSLDLLNRTVIAHLTSESVIEIIKENN